MNSRIPAASGLLVLGAALYFAASGDAPLPAETAKTKVAVSPEATPIGNAVGISTFESFDAWVSSMGERPADESLRAGITAAERRAVLMRKLISTDPEAALARSVSFADYAALPPEIQEHVERPFSATSELLALPICGGKGGVTHTLISGTESFQAHLLDRRAGLDTKEGTPLQGITLGGLAAVRDEVFQVITKEDARAFSSGHRFANRCFATGAELGEQAVTTLAGGKVFRFASTPILQEFEARAAALDEQPGPHTGSRTVILMAGGSDANTTEDAAFDWETAEASVDTEASTWTETPKDVYYIRIDFSDEVGASVSKADLDTNVNGTVTDVIEQISYGKTAINATVSEIVVRMPNPTTTYLPNDNTLLRNEAMAAAEAQIPGLDLGDYDIVAVHFKSIGMRGGSFVYGGLAGGSRQWIQGNNSANLIIHEFGHNYGIYHASFWDTFYTNEAGDIVGDMTVVGAGAQSAEYGDNTDIMGGGPNAGHFHPQAKERLDWLEPNQWTDVTVAGSGTYRVHQFDNQDTTGPTRGLRITKDTAGSESQRGYYWVGYRKGIVANPWLTNGAYLTWERPNNNKSWLIDTTPGSADGKSDGSITLGKTYSDAAAGIHITTIGLGGSAPDSWIDVTINLGNFPGNTVPTVNITGPSTANARQALTFTAAATDADGDPLAYHWDIGDGSIVENAATTDITWATGGTYTINLTVSDMKGGTATASQSITVSDPLDTWEQIASGTTRTINDITSDGTRLVAVGSNSNAYLTSTDGSTWTSGSIGSNRTLSGVIHTGAQFLAAGQNYNFSVSAWQGTIHSSPDGSTWTERHFGGPQLRDIATSGTAHIAVGDDGTIWRSTNTTSWSPISSGTTIDLKGITYGSGTFVAVGSGSPGNSGGPVVVLTSSDGGESWDNTSSGAGTANWQGFYDVQYLNDRFFASGWHSKLRASTDAGATFTPLRTSTEQTPAFAHGNGVYFAAGIDLSNSNAKVNLVSANGITFSPLATSQNYATRNAATFFDNRFYTVGNSGEIWRSSEISTTSTSTTTSIATWLESYFPGSETASPLSDDDADGIANLQEYATGTDPTDTSALTEPTKSETDGYLTLTIPLNPSATDVATQVELSTDMQAWSTADTVILTDTPDMLQVRSATPADTPNGKRQFMRVTFTLRE